MKEEDRATANTKVGDLGEKALQQRRFIFLYLGKGGRVSPSEVYGTITLFVIAANVTITECTESTRGGEARSR